MTVSLKSGRSADDSDIDMCDNRGKAAMMVLCSVAGYTVRELG